MLALINSFKVFREAYLVAGRYPNNSIYMLQHVLSNWFTNLDMQKISAAAVLLMALPSSRSSLCRCAWRIGERNNHEDRNDDCSPVPSCMLFLLALLVWMPLWMLFTGALTPTSELGEHLSGVLGQ